MQQLFRLDEAKVVAGGEKGFSETRILYIVSAAVCSRREIKDSPT